MRVILRPILLELPERLETERLVLRVPRAGDGAAMNAAIRESYAELSCWMPWCKNVPSGEDSEEFARRAHANFILRQSFDCRVFRKNADGSEGLLIGMAGLQPLDWSVPSFEIGYWCRTSMQRRGFTSEAVLALTQFAWQHLHAQRLVIRCDSRNLGSQKVAQRCGFVHETTLRQDARANDGNLRDTLVFSRLLSESD